MWLSIQLYMFKYVQIRSMQDLLATYCIIGNKMELNIQDYPIGVYMFTITDGKDKIIGKFIRQ